MDKYNIVWRTSHSLKHGFRIIQLPGITPLELKEALSLSVYLTNQVNDRNKGHYSIQITNKDLIK